MTGSEWYQELERRLEEADMIEVQIIIPDTGNDGEPHTAKHFEQLERDLLGRFGGFTKLQNASLGAWRDDNGVDYLDNSHVYVVAVSGLVAQAYDLREAIDYARGVFAQESIAFRYLGQMEIL